MAQSMEELFDQSKKGKKNKMKVGDKVKAKPSWVDWHAKNISWLFAAPQNENEREIREESLPAVYFICNAKLGKKRPSGLISRYGAYDNDDNIDRKNVYVTFTLKTEIGDVHYSCYVHEKDLEVVKSKRR